MTTHITFPDIDYTAIVAEANSFLASQPFNEASTELTIHPFPLATLDSLEEIIPSLFTTFVDKNLWNATYENTLIDYQIPNDSYIIKESFLLPELTCDLEKKLKILSFICLLVYFVERFNCL
jgi:hypothetical protein